MITRRHCAVLAALLAATTFGGCADESPPAPNVSVVQAGDRLVRTAIQIRTTPESTTPVIGPAWIVIRPVATYDPVTVVAATPAPAADRPATAMVDLPEGDYAIDVRVWDAAMPAPAGPADQAALAVTEPLLRAWVPSLSLARSQGDQAVLALVVVPLDAPGAADGLARPLVMPVDAAARVSEGQRVVLRTFVLDDRDSRSETLAGTWSDSCAPDGSSLESTTVTIAADAFGDDGRARLLVRWTPGSVGHCTVSFEVRDGLRLHRNATIFPVAAP